MAKGENNNPIRGFAPVKDESELLKITLLVDPVEMRVEFEDEDFVMQQEPLVRAALSEALSRIEAGRAAECMFIALKQGGIFE